MASSIGAAQFLSVKGVPPKFTTKLREFRRTGINGQGYHDTGKHGDQGEVTGEMTFNTDALRLTFEQACANLVGSSVSIVDDLGTTYHYYKVLAISREQKITLASATDGNNYYYAVTFVVQPTYASIAGP